MHSFLIFMAIGQATALTLQHQNVARVPATWSYQGCYTDEADRQLGGEKLVSNSMTPDVCISFCGSKGYEFAGVEYATECFCGHQIRSKSVKKEEKECNMACAGDATASCGGPNRLNIYSNAAPAVVTNPGPVGSNWKYLSCYEDSVYSRTLKHQLSVPANSVEACTSACKGAGYKYAGVEWSNECFCDNTILVGRTGGFDDCDMSCNGKPSEYCGGSQRLNIYEFTPPVSTSTTTVSADKYIQRGRSLANVLKTSIAISTTTLVVTSTTSTTSLAPSTVSPVATLISMLY